MEVDMDAVVGGCHDPPDPLTMLRRRPGNALDFPRTPLQWSGLPSRLGLELGPDSGHCWTQVFGNL